MREAAITAGLVHSVGARDRDWRDRLHIITYASFDPAPLPHLISLGFYHTVNPRQRPCTVRT